MFAITMAGGQMFGMPDVCKTPMPPVGQPVPIPYPNTAMPMMANPATCSMRVMIAAMPPLTLKSKVLMTNGDQAGVAGGVVSGMIMGEAGFTMGSSKVKIEGVPVIRLLSTTTHNGVSANCPAGLVVAPSQTKVLVAP